MIYKYEVKNQRNLISTKNKLITKHNLLKKGNTTDHEEKLNTKRN